jgi:soluble lytic murein transglycosylase-like protein
LLDRPFRVVGIAIGAALLAAASATPCQAGGRIYMYEDENGVTHFTNVPRDRRYKPVEFDWTGPNREAPPPKHWQYDGLIGLTAREHHVRPGLVKAVIAAESNFDPDAVSRAGARGLMQLMPETAASMGVKNLHHPTENVQGGTRYLRQMIDRYGDLVQALAAYNAGPTAVDRYGGLPPYRETRDYVQRVLAYYRHYDGDFGR